MVTQHRFNNGVCAFLYSHFVPSCKYQYCAGRKYYSESSGKVLGFLEGAINLYYNRIRGYAYN